MRRLIGRAPCIPVTFAVTPEIAELADAMKRRFGYRSRRELLEAALWALLEKKEKEK